MIEDQLVIGIPGTTPDIFDSPGFGEGQVGSYLGVIRIRNIRHKCSQVARDGCIGRRKHLRIGYSGLGGIGGIWRIGWNIRCR